MIATLQLPGITCIPRNIAVLVAVYWYFFKLGVSVFHKHILFVPGVHHKPGVGLPTGPGRAGFGSVAGSHQAVRRARDSRGVPNVRHVSLRRPVHRCLPHKIHQDTVYKVNNLIILSSVRNFTSKS